MGSKSPHTTIALVTGANQGIGFEIAKKLGTEHPDYHVLVAGRRKDAIDEAVTKLQALKVSCEPLLLDVTSDDSIAAAVKVVQDKHGRLDVLINNAGISRRLPDQPLATDRASWNAVFDTNVASVALVTDAFIPLLEKSQVTKRIVNITSGLGSVDTLQDKANPFHKHPYTVYGISKAGLNLLTMFYAVKYEDDKTWKFNLSCPGLCKTNLNDYIEYGEDPAVGAINAVRLATLGEDGESGTFSNRAGAHAF